MNSPQSAPRASLIDVANVMRGAVTSKSSDAPDGVAFFGLAEITASGSGAARSVSADDVPDRAPGVEPGDVAVALMSSIGNAALITARHRGAVLGRECALVRPASDRVTGAWIYGWTQSEDFKEQVRLHSTESTMPRLGAKALEQFTLPIPSLVAQRELQEVVSELDDALARVADLQRGLQDLRQTEIELRVAEAAGNDSGAPRDQHARMTDMRGAEA